MVTKFHANSEQPNTFVLQRCLSCFDYIVLQRNDPPSKECPYCGSIQSFDKLDSRIRELAKRLASDEDLRNRDLLLRSLRTWQFRAKNNLLRAEEREGFSPYFYHQKGLKLKLEEVKS